MSAKYILAIDQGTTGSTAMILDRDLRVVGLAGQDFPQHFPKPGWVEHDLDEIWASVLAAVRGAMQHARAKPSEIAAIGITNQRETTCLWERATGKPVMRAIVWQDRRTAPECARLRKRGVEASVRRKTGLVLSPYFSATKLQWMLHSSPTLASAARRGELAFGTIDSFILARLTGAHATDVSNASRTLLMDLRRCRWDEDLLRLFRIPRSVLPEILPSAVEYGRTRRFLDFPDGIPVTGIAGDQQAALFGQACFRPGMAKCTYGTGAFVMVNTGDEPVVSKSGLLTTMGWKIGDSPTYALEGSAFIAGAAVQWLRDGLGLISRSEEIETLAAGVSDADGVLFVPALTGLGAPHWVPEATGLISGITRRTTKGHVARATLEGIAYQVSELLQAMSADMGKRLTTLRVDGGASVNRLLMQFQSDLLGLEVVRPETIETTALGAALQAGLGAGFWSGIEEIRKGWRQQASFRPAMRLAERKARMESWRRAVRAVRSLAVSE